MNTEVLAYRKITAYQLADELKLTDITNIFLAKPGYQPLPPLPYSDYYYDSDESDDSIDFDSDDN